MSNALPALPADVDPDALAASDTPVPTSETRDHGASPGSPAASSPVTEPPPSQVVLVLTEENKRDGNLPGADDPADSDAGDTALPLDLLEPPENDVLPSAEERARHWSRLDNAKLWTDIHGHFVRRKRVNPDVADDLTTLAFMRGMKVNGWPDDGDPKRLFAWLRRCANYVFLESFRSDTRRKKRIENSDDLERHAEAPEDSFEHRYELRERLEMFTKLANKLVAEQPIYAPVLGILLKMTVTDTPLKVLAPAEGLTPEQAQKRIERFWKALHKMAAEASTAGAVAIGMILLFITFTRVPNDVVQARFQPPRADEPLRPVEEPSVEDIRTNALSLCERARYAACLTQLDRAKGMDPEGDKDPKVIAARSAAEKALHPKDAPATP